MTLKEIVDFAKKNKEFLNHEIHVEGYHPKTGMLDNLHVSDLLWHSCTDELIFFVKEM